MSSPAPRLRWVLRSSRSKPAACSLAALAHRRGLEGSSEVGCESELLAELAGGEKPLGHETPARTFSSGEAVAMLAAAAFPPLAAVWNTRGGAAPEFRAAPPRRETTRQVPCSAPRPGQACRCRGRRPLLPPSRLTCALLGSLLSATRFSQREPDDPLRYQSRRLKGWRCHPGDLRGRRGRGCFGSAGGTFSFALEAACFGRALDFFRARGAGLLAASGSPGFSSAGLGASSAAR